jgi:hypothetical protein
MSDEQLDNEFKKRIQEVFDHYEDDTAAEGWALLREKYPEQQSDRPALWLWRYAGVAAILLAVLGIGLWFGLQHKGVKNLAVKNAQHKGPVIVNPANIVKNTQHTADSSANIAGQQTVKTQHGSYHNSNPVITRTAIAKQTNHPINASNNKPIVNSNPAPSAINNNKQNTVAYQSAATNNPALGNAIAKKPSSGNPQTGTTTALTTDNTPKSIVSKQSAGPVIAMLDTNKKAPTPIAKKQPDKSIQSMFDNDSKYMAAHHTNNDIKIKTRSVVFGVYAATYINYSKGSNNQFNAGGGISADIKLTENLSIVTGVAIAQNSFNYNTLTGTTPVFPAAAMATNAYGNAATLERLTPTSKDLDASLVGLDVPVDLKYMFNPKKGNLYVAAGLSSGGFINETYNYSTSYNIDNNTQPTQDATSKKSFDNFYFAKMLNLSFGVGYPMGNGSKLFIEPFVKYPIAGMGDQHILFGSGGINLKFNFDAPKSKR